MAEWEVCPARAAVADRRGVARIHLPIRGVSQTSPPPAHKSAFPWFRDGISASDGLQAASGAGETWHRTPVRDPFRPSPRYRSAPMTATGALLRAGNP